MIYANHCKSVESEDTLDWSELVRDENFMKTCTLLKILIERIESKYSSNIQLQMLCIYSVKMFSIFKVISIPLSLSHQ